MLIYTQSTRIFLHNSLLCRNIIVALLKLLELGEGGRKFLRDCSTCNQVYHLCWGVIGLSGISSLP